MPLRRAAEMHAKILGLGNRREVFCGVPDCSVMLAYLRLLVLFRSIESRCVPPHCCHFCCQLHSHRFVQAAHPDVPRCHETRSLDRVPNQASGICLPFAHSFLASRGVVLTSFACPPYSTRTRPCTTRGDAAPVSQSIFPSCSCVSGICSRIPSSKMTTAIPQCSLETYLVRGSVLQ
jgi:hypothetical protein